MKKLTEDKRLDNNEKTIRLELVHYKYVYKEEHIFRDVVKFTKRTGYYLRNKNISVAIHDIGKPMKNGVVIVKDVIMYTISNTQTNWEIWCYKEDEEQALTELKNVLEQESEEYGKILSAFTKAIT